MSHFTRWFAKWFCTSHQIRIWFWCSKSLLQQLHMSMTIVSNTEIIKKLYQNNHFNDVFAHIIIESAWIWIWVCVWAYIWACDEHVCVYEYVYEYEYEYVLEIFIQIHIMLIHLLILIHKLKTHTLYSHILIQNSYTYSYTYSYSYTYTYLNTYSHTYTYK